MANFEAVELRIPSDTVAGQEVQERIIKSLEKLNYPARDIFGVRLALEEAIVNAIKHGNGMDPAKSVRVAWEIDDSKVHIEIQDEGPGFCPCEVPDPTAEENLEKPCGRGIMLMRAFLTVVEYNEAGNCVRLVKERNGDTDHG